MSRASLSADIGAVSAQIGIALAALAAFVLAPPVQGDMLLLPLRPGAQALDRALSAGAPLMGSGPGGAFVVRGERARLFWPLLAGGVLTVAAAPLGCGERAA